MAKCSFCGNEIERGTGIMLVQDDGRVFNYCSSKCEKNTKLGRKAIHTKWSKRFEGAKK
ncbi:MAG TPA: 50S ribosomal protein L24e [Candidatus Nanoarchaeia archaeon]|nr:50S ribosomal protein L24e [Candidatus Nanoarchaeia archaeon]